MFVKRIADKLVKKISEVSSTTELSEAFTEILDEELRPIAEYIRIPLAYADWTYSNLTDSEKRCLGSSGRLQLIKNWIDRLAVESVKEFEVKAKRFNLMQQSKASAEMRYVGHTEVVVDSVKDLDTPAVERRSATVPLLIQEKAIELARLQLKLETYTLRIEEEQAALAVRKSELSVLRDEIIIKKDQLSDECRNHVRQLNEK